MTPEQKRQKLKEMEARVRAKRLAEAASSEKVVNESTYVWHRGHLTLIPKSILGQ